MLDLAMIALGGSAHQIIFPSNAVERWLQRQWLISQFLLLRGEGSRVHLVVVIAALEVRVRGFCGPYDLGQMGLEH